MARIEKETCGLKWGISLITFSLLLIIFTLILTYPQDRESYVYNTLICNCDQCSYFIAAEDYDYHNCTFHTNDYVCMESINTCKVVTGLVADLQTCLLYIGGIIMEFGVIIAITSQKNKDKILLY